ncbi:MULTISPECIES: TIGR01777 family oxidoreductase [unclassified Microbacterium]|uniref:TIGR01777 family oxidoreductase n=1 Tax=unclassified Microbacterium TaxID=2609290 RepID=UPI003869E3D6
MPDARVVLSGASGLIGRALADSFTADGYRVVRLVRHEAQGPDEVRWAPGSETLDPAVLAGATAVVNLNGASIGHFPWTSRYRRELVWSRIHPTQTLARALRELGDEAPHFVSSSAVGYYPPEGRGRTFEEDGPRGDAFLSDLCGEWESAARTAGENVTLLRTAPVVHRQGVLKPLILLTRLGLSGPIGRGTQVWPWISLDDEVRAIRHVIDQRLTGPVNLSGPQRATANDLGFALARGLNRPYLLRAPVWAMKLALSADAVQALLTVDTHVVPKALLDSGFAFRHPTVEDAVASAL